MNKDELFKMDSVKKDFQFDESVADVFDDMLDRSIPHYSEVIHLTAEILSHTLKSSDTVYDLGCSTGNTLLEIARVIKGRNLSFIGVDDSLSMLEKARKKVSRYTDLSVEFIQDDILDYSFQNAGAVVMNYTLQFLRPVRREEFIKKLYSSLRKGGILIVSEKTISHDPSINRMFIDMYYCFKRSQGYSELEISKKREALENVLIPFSSDENIELFQRAGFKKISPFFQWLNFSSFFAVK